MTHDSPPLLNYRKPEAYRQGFFAGFKAKTAFFYAAPEIKIRGKQVFRDTEE